MMMQKILGRAAVAWVAIWMSLSAAQSGTSILADTRHAPPRLLQ